MQMRGTTTVPQQSHTDADARHHNSPSTIAPKTSAAAGTDVDNYLFPLFEYFGESMLMFTPTHELSFFL